MCSAGRIFSFFFSSFPLFTPFFLFFADFWSIGQGNPSFAGWSYIPPGLIFLLPLAGRVLRAGSVAELGGQCCVENCSATEVHIGSAADRDAVCVAASGAGCTAGCILGYIVDCIMGCIMGTFSTVTVRLWEHANKEEEIQCV